MLFKLFKKSNKKKLNEFLDFMPTDIVGIEAFAYTPFIIAPFSSDKETLKMMIEGIDDKYISFGSTDFEALANFSSELLEDKKPKVLVPAGSFFSTGEKVIKREANSIKIITKLPYIAGGQRLWLVQATEQIYSEIIGPATAFDQVELAKKIIQIGQQLQLLYEISTISNEMVRLATAIAWQNN